MLTFKILVAAALAAGVGAQQSSYTSTSTSSSASPSSTGKIIEIAVGSKLHLFDPEVVTAEVGDTIRFNFYPGAHRVARGEYTQPCIPYEYTGSNRKGFYTGVFDPKTIQLPHPSYDVRVNDTDPIWFYCIAPGSCYEYGMVGAVNPAKNETLKAFKEAAINATYQLIPGEPFPSETVPGTPSPTNTAPPNNGGAGSNGNSNGGSSNSNTQETQKDSGGSNLGAGAIAGIAIGAAAVVIIGAALIYLCGRRGGFDKAYRKSVNPVGPTDGIIPPPMMEHRYGGSPKSPGQATMSTFAGQHDSYRNPTQSPHAQNFTGTPPPPQSPGFTGYGTYNGTNYPVMGDVQGQHAAYQQPLHSPPLHSPQLQAPVELPSADQHAPQSQSPPPQYLQGGNRDSWTAGQESTYRSTKP